MADLFDDRIYIGIIGSRRRNTAPDYRVVLHTLMQTLSRYVMTLSEISARVVIVSGGCALGADRFAEDIARQYRIETIIHKPDKNAHPGVPQPWRATKQNYDRNTLIARDARDYLIACVANDRKGGTEDTIEKWKRIHRKEPIIV